MKAYKSLSREIVHHVKCYHLPLSTFDSWKRAKTTHCSFFCFISSTHRVHSALFQTKPRVVNITHMDWQVTLHSFNDLWAKKNKKLCSGDWQKVMLLSAGGLYLSFPVVKKGNHGMSNSQSCRWCSPLLVIITSSDQNERWSGSHE